MLIRRRRVAWSVASIVLATTHITGAQTEPTPAAPTPAAPTPAAPAPAAAPAPTPTPPPAAPTPTPPPRFGDAGEFVVTGGSSIALSSTSHTEGDAKDVRVTFAPGIDYFAVRGFSIGVDLTLDYRFVRVYAATSPIETTTTTIGAGPRVGLNLSLGDTLSFYPRVTVGIEHIQRDRTFPIASPLSLGPAAPAQSASIGGAYLVVFAPLLLHPAPHFFLGAGPGVFKELGSENNDLLDGERTSFFGRFVIGGWWGGAPTAPATSESSATSEASPASAPASPRAPRFGDARTWAFTNELGADVVHTTYGSSSRTGTSYFVSPGVDYFVTDHFSLGLAAALSRALNASAPQGLLRESSATEIGGEARLGADVPLGPLLSLYPRASIGIAHRTFGDNASGLVSSNASTKVTAALYVPLLVHFASHAFVGFGPSVTHDLLNRVENATHDNLGTTIGAHLVLGGWLSH